MDLLEEVACLLLDSGLTSDCHSNYLILTIKTSMPHRSLASSALGYYLDSNLDLSLDALQELFKISF
jgi:hypothetical protein